MFSLKAKEPTPGQPAPARSSGMDLTKALLLISIVAIAVLAYSNYNTRLMLTDHVVRLETALDSARAEFSKKDTDLASDIDVVSERLGVTSQELESARVFAQRVKEQQEKADEQLASELQTKAAAAEAQVANLRQEATQKLSEVQQEATTKITAVNTEVGAVKTELTATRQEVAEQKRSLVDVKDTLSAQIARNAGELSELRKKGERDFFEFDIKKLKNNRMNKVADIQLAVTKTDIKKQKYTVLIQVDDNRLEKKDQNANSPIQFLVGRSRLRYEVIVNIVDKDRLQGYVSVPKDKVLSAERPVLRQQ